ncbi:MAG: hypothetical protein ACM3XZ_08460 [Betaproteobacteria bacterium]
MTEKCPGHQHSFAGYRNALRMTRQRTILVEGPDDKRALLRLLETFVPDKSIRRSVTIDTAEILMSPSRPLGNREKVEEFCLHECGQEFVGKLVGFVDREFRGFSTHPSIADDVSDHYVNGYLVWSRGHSLENYYFDFGTLREPLRTFSVTVFFDEALARFEHAFESCLRLACASSLAAHEANRVKAVKASIDWKALNLRQNEIELNAPAWRDNMVSRLNLTTQQADFLVESYQRWSAAVATTDPSLIRWLCHGHIGLSVLWAGYARCVYEVTGQDEGETARVLGAEESVRFNACAESWTRRALHDGVPAPLILLEMLGLKAS